MSAIRECLLRLLNDFEQIGDEHEELFDSEVREQVGNALMEAFVRRTEDFAVPTNLGMFGEAGNSMVQSAIIRFV